MSQSKSKDQTDDNSNDDMARSILDETVSQAVNTSTDQHNRNTTHSKPPLPHNKPKNTSHDEQNGNVNNHKNNNEDNNNKTKKDKNKLGSPSKLKKSHSSSNRNIVFHPDHPELINDLSSTSTASQSPNHSPDATLNILHHHKNTVKLSDSAIPTKENSSTKTHKSKMKMIKNDDKKINDANNKNSSSSSNANKNNQTSKSNHNGGNKDNHKNSNKNSKNDSTSKQSAASSSSSSASSSSSTAQQKKDSRRERRRMLNDPNCFPKRFEVQVQARVRVGKELTSQHLTDLPEGSVVTVEEIDERRARISRPLCGWLSVTSKFGARIILPTNSKYSKIGGKVMFKRPISGQPTNPTNGQYPQSAKVVDYNEDNGKYKILYSFGEQQWIDLEHPNVVFVSQHKGVKPSKPIDPTAPTFTLQTSQTFFNQFFCKDYPQYRAQSSSTTRHMDISPIAAHHSRKGQPPMMGYPPPPGHHGHVPHNPMHPPAPHTYPPPHTDPMFMNRAVQGAPGGHGMPNGARPPHRGQQPGAPGPYGQLPPHQQHARHPQQTNGQYPGGPGPNPNHHGGPRPGYPPHGGPPGPHGHPQQTNGQQPGYPPQSQYPPNDPRAMRQPAPPGQYPPNDPRAHPRGDPRQQPQTTGATAGGTGPDAANKSGVVVDKNDPSFVNKVKEIERRIIQHLHQRGYTETHPDYHRYLQKAKELAIQKAGKERERMAKLGQRPTVTKEEYMKYLKYKEEKQRQHAIAEQQRRERERAAAAQQQSGRLTAPSKQQSNSVKGLIVLRGLPGSGKTTLAKKLAQRSKNARICTEDRYHWSGKEDGVGEYKFQPQLVFLAREWCTKEIRECIQQNVNLIILDNHNARISMYEDHIQYAVEHGYRFRIIEFVASASLIDKYRARSYKKFPREVYVKLLKLWEHDPRTELINPTFGAVDDKKQKQGNPPLPAVAKNNISPNDGGQQNDDNNPTTQTTKDEQQTIDQTAKDDEPKQPYPSSQDYSRRPLEQGLNINILNNNNKDNNNSNNNKINNSNSNKPE